jgi:aarF domain-containing kinase
LVAEHWLKTGFLVFFSSLSCFQVVQEELGGLPSEVFASFEPVPIASASLAQVHVATHKDSGQKLAVKVQHRGLRDTATGDVDCVSLAVRAMSTLFPSMPLWWIADELAPNLPIELDFKAEARNADKCREMFSGDSRIAVPDIVHELSSSRVLTMSFEDGVSVSDVKGASQTLNPKSSTLNPQPTLPCAKTKIEGST